MLNLFYQILEEFLNTLFVSLFLYPCALERQKKEMKTEREEEERKKVLLHFCKIPVLLWVACFH